MQLCINDAVYNGSFPDIEKAKVALLSHAKNIVASSGLRANNLVLRTEELKNRHLTGEATIYEFFLSLRESKSPEDKKLLNLLLSSFVKGPYIVIPTHDEEFTLSGEGMGHSALSYCTSSPYTLAVISPDLSGWQSDLLLRNSKEKIVIKNYYCEAQIDSETWKYESNPKHEIPKDIIVKGNVWSKMSLSDKEAQVLLSKSIKIKGKRCSFAKDGEQWYQFYNHGANLFHGFPINNPGNDRDLNRIERFMSDNDCRCCGQLTID